MCNDNDMDGVRLWFYGGTPPLDERLLEDQDLPALPKTGWGWLAGHAAAPSAGRGPAVDHAPALAAA